MKLSVIVIDDSPVQLLIAARLIKQHRHLTLEGAYSNPQLGLQAVNNTEVDIVLLDIEMPEMDGFSLKKLFNKQVEVIMNSTKASFELMAYSAGAIDFLHKPISAPLLDCAIVKIMNEEKLPKGKEELVTAIAS